jgi:hypothetical protein
MQTVIPALLICIPENRSSNDDCWFVFQNVDQQSAIADLHPEMQTIKR